MVDKKNKEQKGDKKMKKSLIKLIILVILTFAINVRLVYADSLTLNDLYEQLKNSEIYYYVENLADSFELSLTNNNINFEYTIIDGNEDFPESIMGNVTYNEDTDTLNYEYFGNLESNEVTYKRLGIESLLISQILVIIAEANGINITNDIDETKLTLEENGVELEMIKVEFDDGYLQGYKSISVKLNDLNFENQNSQTENDDNQTENGNSQNDNNQTGSDTENGNQQSDNENKVDNNENIENPKTGNFISMVTLIIAAIISIFIIVIANKKTVFKKI